VRPIVGFVLSDYCMLIARNSQGVAQDIEIIERSLHEVRYAWNFEACDTVALLQPSINGGGC
jgi:hypothetical protein